MNNYDKQAANFLRSTGTRLTIEFLRKGRYFDTDKEERNIYQFTLTNSAGGYSSTFGSSINATAKGTKPRAYDILACLDANDPGTFDEFCREFGYDDQPLSTYPTVMKTYEAVKAQAEALRVMFTDEQLAALADIL